MTSRARALSTKCAVFLWVGLAVAAVPDSLDFLLQGLASWGLVSGALFLGYLNDAILETCRGDET
jgi:hypothetical protein